MTDSETTPATAAAANNDDDTAVGGIQVKIQPMAFCSMILHAIQHKNDVVHGVLLGQQQSLDSTTILVVEEAVPICHSTPTVPLLETAFALIEAQQQQQQQPNKKNEGKSSSRVIGWYTAPMLLQDTKPGVVAMRVTANLAATAAAQDEGLDNKLAAKKSSSSSNNSMTLVVIQNSILGDLVKQQQQPNAALQAYGPDLGRQYQQPIPTVIEHYTAACQAIVFQSMTATAAASAASSGGMTTQAVVVDLEDHLLHPSVPWYPNHSLRQVVEQHTATTQ